MCGIYAHFEYGLLQSKKNKCEQRAMKCAHRGPDNTTKYEINNAMFVFHRLSINDLSNAGNQPFIIPTQNHKNSEIICLCNGEIYNSKSLIEKYSLPVKSNSDCEVIPLLYVHFKGDIESVVKSLDGYFACVLVDTSTENIFVFRDYFGIRSLYIQERLSNSGNVDNESYLTIASELKCMDENDLINAKQFQPRTIRQYSYSSKKLELIKEYTYYDLQEISKTIKLQYTEGEKQEKEGKGKEKEILINIRRLFKNAVKKRLQSDRKVGTFLSGGFDSSVVANDLSELLPKGTPLYTFSIGMKDSPDLLAARIVATAIKSVHTEYIVTPEEMLEELENTIYDVETYDITTIRASTMMRMLSKFIARDTDIVVVFSGEGSDEASGSYIYFHNAPSSSEFHNETVRLLEDLHYYDVKRGDKCTACAGLEIRVPFLDRDFIEYYMSIDPKLKQPRNGVEKYLLRKAFATDSTCKLPTEIIWRTKEAFSDGVSTQTDSWYQIITKHVNTLEIDSLVYNTEHCRPQTREAAYYRSVFNKFYPHAEHVIPYMWLPKWSGNVTDPSARVLEIYNKLI